MHERVLKTALVALSALLAALVALGVFLVAGTQGGTTAGVINDVLPQPAEAAHSVEHLPVKDR